MMNIALKINAPFISKSIKINRNSLDEILYVLPLMPGALMN